MDPNNMTSDTGRQNHSSVFGFDPYPPSIALNWNQSNSFANPLNPTPTNMCVPNQVSFINNLQPHFAAAAQQIGDIPAAVPSTSTCVPGMTSPAAIHPFGVPTYPEPQTSYSFGTVRPMPEVMHFPFHSPSAAFTPGEFRCKRKTDSPPLQPAKQHITEEKMAEHMSKLHISSETPARSETETSKMRRLYMCEEMRKLQTESILPKSLLEKIEGPCTALVLWKPPASRWVPPSAQNEEVDENDNNNTEILPESNMVDMVDVAVSNMDMDNC